jgi:tRNA(Ile)-lysidine synthase
MSLETKPQPATLTSTRFTTGLERRVLHYIRKQHVIAEGERVIAAASGGADSTALLIILSRLARRLHLDLTVAHFNHQLRTEEEAVADLEYVRSLTSALGLPLAHAGGDVRAYARDQHLSIEDAARRLRYVFLAEQAATLGGTCVAVGHTLDDQAETVLLHLIRGAGLTGISGMTPRSAWPFGAGPDLARPTLFLTRQETERYCWEVGVGPRSDPTNQLLTATRNRVRRELMPVLRKLNPRIEEALARFAAAASADTEYLDELATQAFSALAAPGDSAVALNRPQLAALPRPLASRVICLAFAQAHGTPADIESTHIEAVLDALTGRTGSHSLPGGVTATNAYSSLVISKQQPALPQPIEPTPLAMPGRTLAGPWLIAVRLESPPPNFEHHNPLEAYLDAEKTRADLTVRSRRPGDRLRPLGLGGEKKLQDVLVDAKVPARERDAVPLICVGEQIAWVAGHCIDERFALDPTSHRAVHLLVRLRSPTP